MFFSVFGETVSFWGDFSSDLGPLLCSPLFHAIFANSPHFPQRFGVGAEKIAVLEFGVIFFTCKYIEPLVVCVLVVLRVRVLYGLICYY